MPKVGKKGKERHFKYTKKGRAAAADYAKRIGSKIAEVGPVTGKAIVFKRERTKGDPLAVGRKTTSLEASRGYQTPSQKQKVALSLKQQHHKGKWGGGATIGIRKRKIGITASTEMNWKNKVYEALTEKNWMSGEDLEKYKGRPSRKNRGTRASKKTQAATERRKKKLKKEGDANTKGFTKGTYQQQRGKQ